MSDLIKLETVNAVELFSSRDEIDNLLKKIKEETESFVPNLETAKGRAEIASLAHKVSKSKVTLDGLGKDLVTGWKDQSKKVDNSRKHVRDYLDGLRDTIRQPLTDWENAEKARIERERLAVEETARKERERVEAEQKAREEALQKKADKLAERERVIEANRLAEENARLEVARQEKIKAEAEENAKRAATEEIEAAKRREIEQKIRAEQAERDSVSAASLAKIEQAAAVKKAREDAEMEAKCKENRRIAEENRRREEEAAHLIEAKRVEDAKASNLNHRKSVNNKAVDAFIDALGCDRELGINIVKTIAMNKVPSVKINY